jgi:hypothetical protein
LWDWRLYHLNQFREADLLASTASHLAEDKMPDEPCVLNRVRELLQVTSGQQHETRSSDLRRSEDLVCRQANLCFYASGVDAAYAYDQFALALFGEYARFNVIDQ